MWLFVKMIGSVVMIVAVDTTALTMHEAKIVNNIVSQCCLIVDFLKKATSQ